MATANNNNNIHNIVLMIEADDDHKGGDASQNTAIRERIERACACAASPNIDFN